MAEEKKSIVKTIGSSVRDVVPKTTGGKVAGGIFAAVLSVGSFFVGRLTKGSKKDK